MRRILVSTMGILGHARFMQACLGLALVVRVLWIGLVDTQPVSDFGWYYSQGIRIAHGQGYVVMDDGFPLWKPGNPLPSPKPTAFWPVGYPGFLGILFYSTSWLVEPLLAAKLANVLLYLGVIAAISYCTRTIFDSKVAGRLAALLLALLPNHIAYTALTSVEICFALLTAAGTALLVRSVTSRHWRLLFLSGIVFGLATLTKPQAAPLAGVLLAVLARKTWRSLPALGAVVYAGVLIVLAPWMIRNYRVFDTVVFVSTNGGINLLIGNMPGSWSGSDVMWNQELDHIVRTITDEVARDRAAGRVALRYILDHPGEIAANLPWKLETTYSGDVDGFGWCRVAAHSLTDSFFWGPIRILSQLYYMAVLGCAGLCLWRFRKRIVSQPSFLVGPAIFAYFTTTYLVFFGGARFHFPIVPWMAAYAAGWLDDVLFSSAHKHSEPPSLAPAVTSDTQA